MYSNQGTKGAFSIACLEDNEYYFENIAATLCIHPAIITHIFSINATSGLYPTLPSSSLSSSSSASTAAASASTAAPSSSQQLLRPHLASLRYDDILHTKYKQIPGRLHIATKNLYFVAEETKFPVFKLSFSHCKEYISTASLIERQQYDDDNDQQQQFQHDASTMPAATASASALVSNPLLYFELTQIVSFFPNQPYFTTLLPPSTPMSEILITSARSGLGGGSLVITGQLIKKIFNIHQFAQHKLILPTEDVTSPQYQQKYQETGNGNNSVQERQQSPPILSQQQQQSQQQQHTAATTTTSKTPRLLKPSEAAAHLHIPPKTTHYPNTAQRSTQSTGSSGLFGGMLSWLGFEDTPEGNSSSSQRSNVPMISSTSNPSSSSLSSQNINISQSQNSSTTATTVNNLAATSGATTTSTTYGHPTGSTNTIVSPSVQFSVTDFLQEFALIRQRSLVFTPPALSSVHERSILCLPLLDSFVIHYFSSLFGFSQNHVSWFDNPSDSLLDEMLGMNSLLLLRTHNESSSSFSTVAAAASSATQVDNPALAAHFQPTLTRGKLAKQQQQHNHTTTTTTTTITTNNNQLQQHLPSPHHLSPLPSLLSSHLATYRLLSSSLHNLHQPNRLDVTSAASSSISLTAPSLHRITPQMFLPFSPFASVLCPQLCQPGIGPCFSAPSLLLPSALSSTIPSLSKSRPGVSQAPLRRALLPFSPLLLRGGGGATSPLSPPPSSLPSQYSSIETLLTSLSTCLYLVRAALQLRVVPGLVSASLTSLSTIISSLVSSATLHNSSSLQSPQHILSSSFISSLQHLLPVPQHSPLTLLHRDVARWHIAYTRARLALAQSASTTPLFTVFAQEIQPLSSVPVRLLLTTKFLYIVPLHAPDQVKRVPHNAILSLVKRSCTMEELALEITIRPDGGKSLRAAIKIAETTDISTLPMTTMRQVENNNISSFMHTSSLPIAPVTSSSSSSSSSSAVAPSTSLLPSLLHHLSIVDPEALSQAQLYGYLLQHGTTSARQHFCQTLAEALSKQSVICSNPIFYAQAGIMLPNETNTSYITASGGHASSRVETSALSSSSSVEPSRAKTKGSSLATGVAATATTAATTASSSPLSLPSLIVPSIGTKSVYLVFESVFWRDLFYATLGGLQQNQITKAAEGKALDIFISQQQYMNSLMDQIETIQSTTTSSSVGSNLPSHSSVSPPQLSHPLSSTFSTPTTSSTSSTSSTSTSSSHSKISPPSQDSDEKQPHISSPSNHLLKPQDEEKQPQVVSQHKSQKSFATAAAAVAPSPPIPPAIPFWLHRPISNCSQDTSFGLSSLGSGGSATSESVAAAAASTTLPTLDLSLVLNSSLLSTRAALPLYTALWTQGALSNFDYLLLLNHLAGRSFADFSQFPTFPWVLADYDSSSLDLGNPAVYRDLTKPVGALNEKRLGDTFIPRLQGIVALQEAERAMFGDAQNDDDDDGDNNGDKSSALRPNHIEYSDSFSDEGGLGGAPPGSPNGQLIPEGTETHYSDHSVTIAPNLSMIHAQHVSSSRSPLSSMMSPRGGIAANGASGHGTTLTSPANGPKTKTFPPPYMEGALPMPSSLTRRQGRTGSKTDSPTLSDLLMHPAPFLYGTHFSTPGYVVQFLLRSQPLLFLKLQRGTFDRPERLFRSLSVSWRSATGSPADVRELIPQFFDTDGLAPLGGSVTLPSGQPTFQYIQRKPAVLTATTGTATTASASANPTNRQNLVGCDEDDHSTTTHEANVDVVHHSVAPAAPAPVAAPIAATKTQLVRKPGGWLVNSLHLDLGMTQQHEDINDVTLPPWCYGAAPQRVGPSSSMEPFVPPSSSTGTTTSSLSSDVQPTISSSSSSPPITTSTTTTSSNCSELTVCGMIPPHSHFISVLRAALDGPIVTAALPAWIDLTFGVKQRGIASLVSLNLFFPLTYPGLIDIAGLDDAKERSFVQTQLNEYGQCPSQLFFSPHPPHGNNVCGVAWNELCGIAGGLVMDLEQQSGISSSSSSSSSSLPSSSSTAAAAAAATTTSSSSSSSTASRQQEEYRNYIQQQLSYIRANQDKEQTKTVQQQQQTQNRFDRLDTMLSPTQVHDAQLDTIVMAGNAQDTTVLVAQIIHHLVSENKHLPSQQSSSSSQMEKNTIDCVAPTVIQQSISTSTSTSSTGIPPPFAQANSFVRGIVLWNELQDIIQLELSQWRQQLYRYNMTQHQ